MSNANFPFYSDYFDFKDDGDFYKVNHSDSPAFGALWEDEQHSPPSASPLEQVIFKLGFKAWLAVQNVKWSERDPSGSFVYLRNFDWSVGCTLNVVNPPPARPRTDLQRCTPSFGPIGKGAAGTPSFTELIANEAAKFESKVLGKDRTGPGPAPHR